MKHGYGISRTLRALELLAFNPQSATSLAASLMIDTRTARGLLEVLRAEQYAERLVGRRRGAVYSSTIRLVSLAAQLERRHPLLVRCSRATERLHAEIGLSAYVVVPSYEDVLVIAADGDDAPRRGEMLPAARTPTGQVLLAHRAAWRQSQPDAGGLDEAAAATRRRGFASSSQNGTTTVAVTCAIEEEPLLALAAAGPAFPVGPSIVEALHRAAYSLLCPAPTSAGCDG